MVLSQVKKGSPIDDRDSAEVQWSKLAFIFSLPVLCRLKLAAAQGGFFFTYFLESGFDRLDYSLFI